MLGQKLTLQFRGLPHKAVEAQEGFIKSGNEHQFKKIGSACVDHVESHSRFVT